MRHPLFQLLVRVDPGDCGGGVLTLESAGGPTYRLRRFARVVPALALVFVSTFVPVARAQNAGGSSGVLITGRDMGLFAGATAGSAALSLFDVPIARAFGDSAFHLRHPALTTTAKRASLATETVLMLTGGTVYGIARLRHDDGTADVALHTTESVLTTALVIQVVRGVLGRARPHVTDKVGDHRDTNPYDFQPLHGFTSFNYRSFPSMHAMANFAVATALTQEMRQRDTPHRQLVSPLLYAGASLPALARMYLDEHWSSDIAMGVFLGVFVGQKVVSYSHEHTDNVVDRRLLRPRASLGLIHDARGFSLFASPF